MVKEHYHPASCGHHRSPGSYLVPIGSRESSLRRDAIATDEEHVNNEIAHHVDARRINHRHRVFPEEAADDVHIDRVSRRFLDPSLINVVHDHYVASVARIRKFDNRQLLGWEAPVLAGRLAEPIADSIRLATHETLLELNALQPTRLGLILRSMTDRHAEPSSR